MSENYPNNPPAAETLATERRRSPRAPLQGRIIGRSADKGMLQAEGLNISMGGIAMLYPHPLSVGERLDLKIPLRLQGEMRYLSARGVVRHCVPQENGNYIGLMFDSLAETAARLVKTYVDSAS